jgi:hypothetical protein
VVARLVRWIKSYLLRPSEDPTDEEIVQIHKRLRELIDHVPTASAPLPSAPPSNETETAQ